MRSALKKVKFALVGLFIFLFVVVTPTHAATWSAWLQSQFSVDTILFSFVCKLVGGCEVEAKPSADASNPTPTIALNPNRGQLGGVLGFGTDTMIAMYSNPPTSSTYYLATIGKEFGIESAYAQVEGSGAGMIRPVEQLWQILRNVSYLFFIIIFVTIGFMIMLRQKLNPQTVITVQSALPGLVVGLILVTFSYFIAALITDFAFFGVQIVAQVFLSVVNDGKVVNVFDPQQLAQDSSIMSMYKSSMATGFTSIPNLYRDYAAQGGSLWNSSTLLDVGFAGLMGGVVSAVAAGITGAWIPLTIAGVAVLALPLIVVLILLIALTIQFGKLIFKLLMAYIMILITTALGPLYITFSMLPGKGNFVGMWWKTILGNALVFPAVFAVFLFAGMILATDPKQWTSTPPLFGNLSVELLQPLIAFVILLGTPAVPDMVKKAVGVADLGPIGSTGIGGFMAGYGVGGKALNESYKKMGIAQALSARDKYKEANRARALGLDRYNEALTIERAREHAAARSPWNRFLNKAVFGFKKPKEYGTINRPWVSEEETKAAGGVQPQTATEAQGVDTTPEQNT